MEGTYDTRLKKDVSCWTGSEVFYGLGLAPGSAVSRSSLKLIRTTLPFLK